MEKIWNCMNSEGEWVPISVTIIDDFDNKVNSNINAVENDKSWEFIAPLPGVKKEEINVSFKNDVMTITSHETRFCEGLDYSFKFDYNVEVNMVKVYLESGVLNVIVDKPTSKEFNIDIE